MPESNDTTLLVANVQVGRKETSIGVLRHAEHPEYFARSQENVMAKRPSVSAIFQQSSNARAVFSRSRETKPARP
jgi:hypothetical protein